jgi:prevent-host-death family protein
VTVGGPLQALGAREARDRLRVLVDRIADGEGPFLILRDAEPRAVLIRYAEAERWGRIDRSLWLLHGLEVYPELARSATELEATVRGERRPTPGQVRTLDRPHDIGHFVRTTGITDARIKFAELLDAVGAGRPQTIVSGGRLVATLLRPAEYERLLGLSRTVAWFAAHGLDLASGEELIVDNEREIATWLADFRAGRRPRAASDTDARSASA